MSTNKIILSSGQGFRRNNETSWKPSYIDCRFEMDMKCLLGKMDRMEAFMEKIVDAIDYLARTREPQHTEYASEIPEISEAMEGGPQLIKIQSEPDEGYEIVEEEIAYEEEPEVESEPQYEEFESLDVEVDANVTPPNLKMEIKRESKKRVISSASKFVKRPRSSRSKSLIPAKRDRINFDGPCDLPLEGKEIGIIEKWLSESPENYNAFVDKLLKLKRMNGDPKLVLRQLFTDDVYDLYTFDAEKQPRNYHRLEMRKLKIFTEVLREVFNITSEESEDILKREIVLGRKRNVSRGVRPADIICSPAYQRGSYIAKEELE